jgi:hypothetical protein
MMPRTHPCAQPQGLHRTRKLLSSHYPLALNSGFPHRASFEALHSTPNAQWARCPVLCMVAAATVLLELLIRHLLNATYAAQAFAEIHEGLTHRTRTHVVPGALNRCGASERYIAVGSRVQGMPSWHQHSAACVQPAIASCLHLIVHVCASVTSVNLSVHTPGYQSKMGIYIGKMTRVPSSVQPLAAGYFSQARALRRALLCLLGGLALLRVDGHVCAC